MRMPLARSWPWLAVLCALLGTPRPAAAGEAEERALRDLVARLAAQVEMLAAKVERLDKRLGELQARLTLAEGKAAPAAAAPAGEDGAVAAKKAAGPDRPVEKAAKPAASKSAALAARIPTGRAFKHAHRITAEFMEKISRTFVRLVPFPVEVVSPGGDLAMGALVAYEGRVPTALPETAQIDFVSSASHWKATDEHPVVFYVDNTRRVLGKAAYSEELAVGGARTVRLVIAVPLDKFVDIATGTQVTGTLGEVEFNVPEAGLEALRDLLCRLTPPAPAAGTAPAAAR